MLSSEIYRLPSGGKRTHLVREAILSRIFCKSCLLLCFIIVEGAWKHLFSALNCEKFIYPEFRQNASQNLRRSYLYLINERPLREDLCLQQLVLQHRGPLSHLGQPRQVPLDVSLLGEEYI